MTKFNELRKAFEASTPGEWEHHWKLRWSVRHVSKNPYITGGRDDKPLSEEDAAFIALVRNTMPQLLEAVEVMKALGEAYDIGQQATPKSAIGRYRAILKSFK